MQLNPITRPPTTKQLALMKFVWIYTMTNNHFPSTRTIQQAFGFKSQNAAVCHLQALVRRKLLNHTKGGYSLPTQTPNP